ncbi:MAG: hypothetical protein HQ519_06770 [Planctomycetes bacterium]|nr:hypothetical protein [Planctomycetota bacterium]
MLSSATLRLPLLLALVVLPLSCGSSSSSGGSGGTGGTGEDVQVNFSGPQSSSPISATKVVISWLDASNTAGDPPSSMSYKVYRSTALDLADETLVGTTSPGVTSYVDGGLAGTGKQTYFYRVVAADVFGNLSVNANVVSAHPPAAIQSGSIDFATDVQPLFDLEGEAVIPGPESGPITCLDCHDGTTNILATEANYTTYAGIVIGVGTSGSPDSWLVPGNGNQTSNQFLSRFWTYDNGNPNAAAAHGAAGAGYHNSTNDLQAFANALKSWANEGGLEAPDTERPVMDFTNVNNSSYEASYDLGNDQVTITTFHASDPESQAGMLTDPLRYRVYGGLSSTTIDWDTPLVETDRNIYSMTSNVTMTFAYSGATGVFVVRAVDFEGNESLNETELKVTR